MSDHETVIEITNRTGLHARPAVKLTKLAKTFSGATLHIALAESGPWIDAKSVVKVMAMRAAHGASLHIRASGEQAEEAFSALIALVRRDFDEGHDSAAADASP